MTRFAISLGSMQDNVLRNPNPRRRQVKERVCEFPVTIRLSWRRSGMAELFFNFSPFDDGHPSPSFSIVTHYSRLVFLRTLRSIFDLPSVLLLSAPGMFRAF